MKLHKKIGVFLLTICMATLANAQENKAVASPAETATGKINGICH